MQNTSRNSSINSIGCSLSMAHGIPLIIINVIVCVFGTLGNFLVCLAIATNSRLRRAPNYLLFSLATADLTVTMIGEPLLLEFISRITFFQECTASLQQIVYYALADLACAISVSHMVAISFDRFVAITFPLRHKIFLKKWGQKVMLIASWFIPILGATLFFIISPASSSYISVGFGMFVFSCLSIFVFHFLAVVFLLHQRKTRKQLRAQTFSLKLTPRMEVRVACTLAIATGVFTVCWTPLMSAFAPSKPLVKWNGPAHLWLQTLALSNSAMNFLIYSARMRDFRYAYTVIARTILRL